MAINNNLISLHNHSSHSFDANFSMQDMADAAQKKGYKHFAFSEHQDFDKNLKEYMNLDFEEYKNEFNELCQNNQFNLNLYLSVEIDWQSRFSQVINRYISTIKNRVDFLIGSIHYVNGEAIDMPSIKDSIGDNFEKLDFLISSYFNEYLAMVESGYFNIAAHMDLFKLYIMELVMPHAKWIKKYEHIILKIFSVMKKHDIILEFNSAGFKKNLTEGYPCVDLLKMYYENGNRLITWSDDAHSPNEIGMFNNKISLLKDIGFKNLYIPTKEGIKEISIWM